MIIIILKIKIKIIIIIIIIINIIINIMAFLRSFTLPVNVGNVNHSFFDKSFCCYFVRLLVIR